MNVISIRTGAAALCLFLGLAWLSAQERQSVTSVTFKEGKVLIPSGDKSVEATNEVVLPGEIVVNTNGVFTVKNGKERQLREGQTIGADGMLVSPDGSVVPVTDHLLMKAGRVYLVRDGESAPLPREFALPDATRVTPDGIIRERDGKYRRMLDGQLLKLDGLSLPTTDTASLRNGRVVLYKDGGRVELRPGQAIAMSDGTRVNGDGTVVRPNGTMARLREGEILKIPGVIPPRK